MALASMHIWHLHLSHPLRASSAEGHQGTCQSARVLPSLNMAGPLTVSGSPAASQQAAAASEGKHKLSALASSPWLVGGDVQEAVRRAAEAGSTGSWDAEDSPALRHSAVDSAAAAVNAARAWLCGGLSEVTASSNAEAAGAAASSSGQRSGSDHDLERQASGFTPLRGAAGSGSSSSAAIYVSLELSCALLWLAVSRLGGRETQAALLAAVSELALSSSALLRSACYKSPIEAEAASNAPSNSPKSWQGAHAAPSSLLRPSVGAVADVVLGPAGVQCSHGLSEHPQLLAAWLHAQRNVMLAAHAAGALLQTLAPLWMSVKVRG